MAVKGKGMAPLDPLEDFDNPTKIEPAQAEPEAEAAPEEQLELEGTKPDEPKMIREGKMLCEFVRPHFDKEESGDRYVGFEFSVALTKEHEENGHLPHEVLEEWLHMRKGNVKRTEVESVAQQTIAIGLVPDDQEHDLILVAAAIQKPILAIVQETGSGKKGKVIRFSFRAVIGQLDQFAKFAVEHHGDSLWISLQRTQGSLLP